MNMEDVMEGLDLLIKQKKRRPNYARIISMEFSKSSTVTTKSKKKISKTQDQGILSSSGATGQTDINDDKICNKNSDDSEYYSAEEFLLSSSSSGISTDEDSSEHSLDQSTDSLFTALESSFNSNFSITETPPSSSASNSSQVRHRAPSKKQKRKKRLSTTTVNSYNNFTFPLFITDSFNIELGELKQETVEREMSVLKPVPSLVELCINASKHLAKTHANLKVPKSVRQILQIGVSDHSFRQLQLENLFHVIESIPQIITNCHFPSRITTKCHFPSRSVWGLDNGCNSQNQGTKSVMYLSYLCNYYVNEDNFILHRGYMTGDILKGKRLAALAHAIDLLLPARLPGNKSIRRRHKSDADCCSAEIDERIKSIKKMIQHRIAIPNNSQLDDSVFDIVIPYVFWARGDIKKAEQGFLSFVEKEHRVRVKALYLCEAGRMMLQFDCPDAASRYFCLAKDALETKEKHTKDKYGIPYELDRQTRILAAFSMDIGVPSLEKAENSLGKWISAISSPLTESDVKCAGLHSAMDAFLGYYGAYWAEKCGSLYEVAIERLSNLTTKHPTLFYYLSMVYALQGKGEESCKMYRRYLVNATIVGSGLGLSPGNNKKIWQPLADKVTEQEEPISPMKVAWRTQLVHPKCADPNLLGGNNYSPPHEADVCNKDINLRISNDGDLTGDMQMMLPPMRGIHLDLYTGKLNLRKTPSATEPWKTFESDLTLNLRRGLSVCQGTQSFLPTPIELYSGPYGERVEMIYTSMYGVRETFKEDMSYNPHLCHLIWTGPDGQKVKINVYHRVRMFLAEAWKKRVMNNINYSSEVKAEVIRLHPKYILKGWNFLGNSGDRIFKHASLNLEKRQKLRDAKTGKKKPLTYVTDPQIGEFFVKSHCSFRGGLALMMRFDHDDDILMVINCTSKDLFRRPKFTHLESTFRHLVQQCPILKNMSDCFCVCCEKNNIGAYITYDIHGEPVTDPFVTMFLDDSGQKQLDPITHHSTVYFLNQDKRLTSDCNGLVSSVDYFGQMFGLGSIADVLVALTTAGEVKFIDLPSLVPLEPLMALHKPLDSTIWDQDKLKVKTTHSFKRMKILGEATFKDDEGKPYTRGAVAIDNLLLVVKVQRNNLDEDATVTITQSQTLAGFPKEIYFINETIGFLLTVTQNIQSLHDYRENLYLYNHLGQIKQVLLNLGLGPRCFLTLFLPPNTDQDFTDPDHGKAGWRVYMRDGHDGIICALLQ